MSASKWDAMQRRKAARRAINAGRLEGRGRIPVIIYGGGEPPLPISLDTNIAAQLIFADGIRPTIFELDIDGKRERVIARDFQGDAVRDFPIHVDFLRLKQGARFKVQVPIRFVNQEASPGLMGGGALEIVRHTVEMYVSAENIPEEIVADLTGMDFDDSLNMSQISLPEGCELINADKQSTIALIRAPFLETENVELGLHLDSMITMSSIDEVLERVTESLERSSSTMETLIRETRGDLIEFEVRRKKIDRVQTETREVLLELFGDL